MGYAIIIGKLKLNTEEAIKNINEEGDGHCFQWKMDIEECEGEEPEGLTSPEYTISVGKPRRDPGYIGWSEFMACCEPLKEIKEEAINPGGSDGYCYALNTDFIKTKIEETEKLIPSMSAVNQDRAKWFCFWIKESITRYGNDAAIGFW